MGGRFVAAGNGVLESWSQRREVLNCMRFIQSSEGTKLLSDKYIAAEKEVHEALDPPMPLILGAASVYAATFVSLRHALRARPLVLQLAACMPAGATLCLGGLCRCHGLL